MEDPGRAAARPRPHATRLSDTWNPAQYERFRDERSAPFFDLLALVQPVDAPSVVDLGCGTGKLTAQAHAALAARETVGIDSSPAMLAEAADVAVGVDGLTFHEGDLATFADADGVDVILSNAALHWVDDHERVLAGWRESLRDGGQVAVQMPINADHPSHVLARALAEEEPFVSAFGGPVPVDPVMRVLPPEQYAGVLERLGFTEQHVRVQVYLHHLPSTVDVVQWMKGTNLTRFEESLPPELYAEYLDRYRARLLDTLGEHRPFPYTYKRVLFWARKVD